MKTIVLFFILLASSVMTMYAQEGFRIEGTVAGSPSGEIYLITPTTRRADTLAVSTMQGGVFSFTGKVERPCVALIMSPGIKGPIPVMLENTGFKISMGVTGISVEGGGADQKLYNEYMEKNMKLSRELKKMQTEYQVAVGSMDQMKVKAIQGQMDKFVKESQQEMNAWMRENGNSHVLAFIVFTSSQKMNGQQTGILYELLGPDARDSFYGKALAAKIQMQQRVAVGEIAPNFTVTTPEGKPISLYDIKGKVKLIDFWASWCAPCRVKNKNVVKIYKKYHDKGLEIFGVSMDDDAEAWKKAIKEDGLTWQHGSELTGRQKSPVYRLYDIHGIPHTLLLDENNRIVAKNLRGDALRAKIAEMLKEK